MKSIKPISGGILDTPFPVDNLLTWFERHRRDLPWRGSRDIYAIWVSEIMLQQTQVATVIDYYTRFMAIFSTVEDLARASLDDVLRLWEGLGYYARARNFKKAAEIVVNDLAGKIPSEPEQFRRLPGVGDYICAAVMSIACGHPLPVIDGNVIRVYSRFIGYYENVRTQRAKNQIRDYLSSIIPIKCPGAFNEALMELGAVICKPQKPHCFRCPLKNTCHALREQKIMEIPLTIKAAPIPHYIVALAIFVDQNRLFIQKRPPEGHLGGLWEFPGGKQLPEESIETTLIRECWEELTIIPRIQKKLNPVNHAYSHFKITIHPFICEIAEGIIHTEREWRWIEWDQINEFAFPQANRKIFKQLN